MKTQINTSADMIGKYLNRYLYSDVYPIGKIVEIKSKTTVIVQRVTPTENKTKMKFQLGGFSAHCVNNYAQDYDFILEAERFEIRLSKQFLKYVRIDDQPVYFYDFNF